MFQFLRVLLLQAMESSPESRWYIFGSFSRGDPEYKDIDVCVICANDRDAQLIRSSCDNLCSSLPIDLIILTEIEECALHFIESENCKLIEFQ
jgi:predicted nucleotidyltransferase